MDDHKAYTVLYHDGDKETYELGSMELATIVQKARESSDVPHNSPEHGQLLECPKNGSRISVFWESEGEYFDGAVKKCKGAEIFIEYDDGDKEWIDFREHKWRILSHLDASIRYSIGTPVKKYFAGHGWFGGIIASSRNGYIVVYDDGDEEVFVRDSIELATIVQKAGEETSS